MGTRSLTHTPEEVGKTYDIDEWQNSQLDSDHINLPITADLYVITTQLYQAVLERISRKSEDIIHLQLKKPFQALLLWAQQHDITSEKLDDTLYHSHQLQKSTLKALLYIGCIIMDRVVPRADVPTEELENLCVQLQTSKDQINFILKKDPDVEVGDGDSFDEATSETSTLFEFDSFSEIANDLDAKTSNLMDMTPLYESATECLLSYENEAVAKFPHVNDKLATHLEEVNFRRFLNIVDSRLENDTLVRENKNHEGFKSMALGKSNTDISRTRLVSPPGKGLLKASMSSDQGDEKIRRVPPIPADGVCTACAEDVTFLDEIDWKRHLFYDLQPYYCLELSCLSLVPFSSRGDWVLHLASNHGNEEKKWPSFQCNLCFKETGTGKATVTYHLEKHLQDIALMVIPTEIGDSYDLKTNIPIPETHDTYTRDSDSGISESVSNPRVGMIQPRTSPHYRLSRRDPLSCNQCRESFPTRWELNWHGIEKDHLAYACICGTAFTHLDALERHIPTTDTTEEGPAPSEAGTNLQITKSPRVEKAHFNTGEQPLDRLRLRSTSTISKVTADFAGDHPLLGDSPSKLPAKSELKGQNIRPKEVKGSGKPQASDAVVGIN
ncbi:uncharacterized protein F4822DRAFT_430956 [Hypoxylon trugodes]|uniref:uncharacterized protein n=1 Tax=Hypoxylon trugodes TaxID=326681 RepID=UPI00219CE5ED|nr:uncharacterized protein F4822DRAFT_430956 [Hypoxylon trugodes]KAI1386085.1 hypothetical protein F4822DRAFT_430956 [Hypoxylon trugodes]